LVSPEAIGGNQSRHCSSLPYRVSSSPEIALDTNGNDSGQPCAGVSVVDAASTEHEPEAFDAEHPLFLLYTSGTTGKPKGIMHTTGGFLTQTSYTHFNVFDVKPETDVFWCTADIGWVTGHSYIVYGPLSNGVTQVVYEGTPASPNEIATSRSSKSTASPSITRRRRWFARS
jgi:acetyl-CoA synthetase